MLDQITDFISDIPISLIIFAIALLFGFFGRGGDNQQEQQQRQREAAPPPEPSIYSSDDRRASEQFDRGGALDFGSNDDMFRGQTQWGQTQYGFDESEWGSTFDEDRDDDARWGSGGDKRDSEPRIEIG